MGSSFEAHRDRRTLFGEDVAAYEARPGYPDRVFTLLHDRCGLGPSSTVVEIGPGTGQATCELLASGAAVVAVELSEQFAAHLRSAYADEHLRVVVGAFEDTDLRPGSADLVVSATAFHWVPTEAGIERAAHCLRDGGSLALWWNVFEDPNRPDPFGDALTPVLERVAPSLLDVPGAGNVVDGTPPYALDVRARTGDFAVDDRFGEVYHETISWTGHHDARALRLLFGSFSPWLALPEAERIVALDALEQLAIDDFGGVVERPYLTPIYIATKH